MKLSRGTKITLLVVLLLVVDQVIKILVKTNMTLGQSLQPVTATEVLATDIILES